jgi:hypothetical protein
MTFPLTTPRDHRRAEKIRLAAQTVAHLDRMGADPNETYVRRNPQTVDRIRLKTPWLVVYPSTFLARGAWKEEVRTQVRFYLNAPAHDLLFERRGIALPIAAYLAIDREADALRISGGNSTARQGWPVTIHPSKSNHFGHSHVGNELYRLGYALDGETTYFPLTTEQSPGTWSLVADLSTAYTKADAIAHEEDIRKR